MLSVLAADIRWGLVAVTEGRVRAREEVGARGCWMGQNYHRKKASNPFEIVGSRLGLTFKGPSVGQGFRLFPSQSGQLTQPSFWYKLYGSQGMLSGFGEYPESKFLM